MASQMLLRTPQWSPNAPRFPALEPAWWYICYLKRDSLVLQNTWRTRCGGTQFLVRRGKVCLKEVNHIMPDLSNRYWSHYPVPVYLCVMERFLKRCKSDFGEFFNMPLCLLVSPWNCYLGTSICLQCSLLISVFLEWVILKNYVLL
jgi:hypothetical protein